MDDSMSDNEDFMDVDGETVQKRFKYKSYNAELKDVHLPSALSAHSKVDEDLEVQKPSDTQSHFYEALLHWQQLNLSPSFIKFSQKTGSLSLTLPLLLHNWRQVVDFWLEAQAGSDDEGLKPLLEYDLFLASGHLLMDPFSLLQKIAQDLRLTLLPVYPDLVDRLLQLAARSISTDALTVLLSTLSSLFKYLLIPSIDSTPLEQTWIAFRKTLPKCVPEIQRALAEVWGSVLRKLKTSLRPKAVVLVAANIENIDAAAAWCFISACKSVSQTLHTVTPTLFAPLLEFHLSCEESDSSFTLVRRILTAFIHHVKGPEQFSSIADIVIKEFTKKTSEATGPENGGEPLRRIVEVAAVLASVRNGSRLTPTNLKQLFTSAKEIPVPIPTSLHSAMLKLTSAIFTASDVTLVSSGRDLLTRFWNEGSREDAQIILNFYGVLSTTEKRWVGWKSFGLPELLKRTGKLLEVEPRRTARLMASLCKDGKLGEVDLVWRKKIVNWVLLRLTELNQKDGELDEEQGAELDDLMALSTFFTLEITRSTALFVDRQIKVVPSASTGEDDVFPRPAWVIGTLLKCLATRPVAEWKQEVDVTSWARLILKHWSWSKHVLEGLVDLASISDGSDQTLSFEETYEGLKDAVLSHSHTIRLNALKLLCSPLFKALSSNTRQVLDRCLQAEQVSLDVQGVRERVVKIGRISQVLKNDDEIGTDLSIRWLIAQLKVNLRPLWAPAASALSDLSQRCDEAVWKVLFRELKVLMLNEGLLPPSGKEKGEDDRSGNPDDPWEEERTWRDPSAHKLREVVIHWLDERSHWKEIMQKSGGNDRFDKRSYEGQVLHTFEECHSLAEKHNRELIQLFLETSGPVTEPTMPRAKLSAWLSLFSKFTNPKALHATESLQSLYTALLSHSDRNLQTLALSCLFTYKKRALTLYENKLGALLDETRWRDELTLLDMAAIEIESRPEVVDVIVRLLFGIMLEKKGRGPDRRSAVLTALAGCTDAELFLLVDLMLRPITDGLDRQLLGFLTLLGDVMKNLGSRLVKYWPSLLGATIDIVAKAEEEDTLPNLENTQAPSALLELFHVWTLHHTQVYFLVEYDPQVIPKIFSCLTAVNVKPAVVSRIFDIVDRLLVIAADDDKAQKTILQPNVSLLLSNLSVLVQHSKSVASISTPLGQRQIGILSQIAPYSSNAEEASLLLTLFSPLLRRPAKVVSEKIKVDLLKIVGHQMHLIPDLSLVSSEVYQRLYELLSVLFQSLRSRQARLSLVGAFSDLAKIQVSLQDLAQLMGSLNAYSTKRIDEPDFERRLAAFAELNDSLYQNMAVSDWLPVLYNMLHAIQDPEELAIRNSASFTIRRFIDLLAMQTSAEHEKIFSRILFPGLKNGLKTKHEMVRAELLGVIAYAVTKCDNVNALQDMKPLLASGDEEANFFNNIHHVQIHRRSRALRRLADQCDERPFRNSTLTEIIIPLISNFIVETSSLDHHLVNDAINTTGRLAKHLSWKSYYALVHKYLRLSKARDEKERVYVRTVVSVLENFSFVMEEEAEVETVVEEKALEDDAEEEVKPTAHSRVVDAVNLHLLPTLLTYLESRDATTEDTTRIPIAVGVVKVARNLPHASAQLQITRLLTTTSQILRSKSQETRDLTRDTLCRIAVVLGPEYLALMFKELRAALLRGPHLHILAATVHHIVAHVTKGDHAEKFAVLDDCVPDIAYVSSEVIFGESGKNVQAEGFKTKLHEVKSSSSKGLHSFQITAKYIAPARVNALLVPLRSIMQETESLKVMQLVDEVLKQIASGLNSNQNLSTTDLLSLCHTLIIQNSRFLQQAAPRRKHLVKGDAIVQTKRQVAFRGVWSGFTQYGTPSQQI
ncbi:hypothetical protein D9757_003643 [Collybiopsis confluens]|uniref:U3 small nucleolar RNA-associated protein 20 n=1 Tax=Collybiopsis confluens TaxID=2823264 RepID=A0A8H5HV93_9AGAR|nr:hypothetical protein D9757_003643 [Collybiopsis confluens]